MITVTMPIKEYESLKNEIKRLNKESVRNFYDKKYSDVVKNEYDVEIDTGAIYKFANSKEKDKYDSFNEKMNEVRCKLQHIT